MKKISNLAMKEMRKQTNNFVNSIKKESEATRKKSIENSRALIELDKKSKKKSNKKAKKSQEPIKEEVQEVKVHPSFLALFWLSITFLAIITLLGY